MTTQSEEHLVDLIETAAERAISALFREHPEEQFYYCSLITTGEASRPFLSAWSDEALDREVAAQGGSREELRWSYADSPYLYYGDEYFREVERIFSERPDINAPADQWYEEYDLRLRCMEEAMKRLDNKRLFGEGEKRRNIIINVEVAPPDYTNTERAIRLNPRGTLLTEWFATAAVPSPEWYAGDEAGQLGYFMTIGDAWKPDSIRSSFEEAELVRNYFYNIDDSTSEFQILHDNIPDKLDLDQKEKYIESSTIMVKKGIYCFGTTFNRMRSFYFPIAKPTRSISINDVPEHIRDILLKTTLKINFSTVRQVGKKDLIS